MSDGEAAAIGSIASSVISGGFNRSSAKDAMKYQTRIAKNRHRWAAKDLERAGLRNYSTRT